MRWSAGFSFGRMVCGRQLRRREFRTFVCAAWALILPIAVSPGSAAPDKSSTSSVDIGTAKVVDLTYPFDDKTIYWPTAPSNFDLKSLAFGETPGGYFYAANSFCTPEHGGTHLDAPVHFAKGGKAADEISVRKLIAPDVVIHVSAKASADPDYRLSMHDLRALERKHGAIPSSAIALLRT